MEHAWSYFHYSTNFFCGLILPNSQIKAANLISQKISKVTDLTFKLDEQNIPHVVLLKTVIPEQNLTEAYQALEVMAQNMIPFTMEWGSVETTSSMLIIWGLINNILSIFQLAVLETLKPLREGEHQAKFDHFINKFTPEELDSLARWGSPWAEPYSPHMVIAKADKPLTLNQFEAKWDFSSCEFSGIIVGTRNLNGNLTAYKQFPFGQYQPQPESLT